MFCVHCLFTVTSMGEIFTEKKQKKQNRKEQKESDYRKKISRRNICWLCPCCADRTIIMIVLLWMRPLLITLMKKKLPVLSAMFVKNVLYVSVCFCMCTVHMEICIKCRYMNKGLKEKPLICVSVMFLPCAISCGKPTCQILWPWVKASFLEECAEIPMIRS